MVKRKDGKKTEGRSKKWKGKKETEGGNMHPMPTAYSGDTYTRYETRSVCSGAHRTADTDHTGA